MFIPSITSRPLTDGRNRTSNEPISGMIVHSIGEWVVAADGGKHYAPKFLETIGLSVHSFITPDGTIIQSAMDSRVTYHAGKSRFEELSNLNRYFLGCEFMVEGVQTYGSFLEAIKSPNCYSEQQYRAGGYWFARKSLYNLGIDGHTIVGHSEVSPDAVRGPGKGKRDPGAGFDWDRFWFWYGWYTIRL